MVSLLKKNYTWKIILILVTMLGVIQPVFAETAQATHTRPRHHIKHIKKTTTKKTTAKRTHIKQANNKFKLDPKKSKKNNRKIKKKVRVTHAATHATLAPQTHLPEIKPVASSVPQRLVSYVQKTIATLRYTSYKMGGGKFDLSHGIYILDCSRYVDKILQTFYPKAYSSLANSTGSDRPNTEHYYDFFSKLSDSPKTHWNKIDDVAKLKEGDVLVFRYKNRLGNSTGGHIMIVMDKPIKNGETFLVRVADSASGGHSKDTRSARSSGIGIGTLLLKVDPETYQPYAYAWRVGSRLNTNVKFAMARPVEIPQAQIH